MFDPNHRYQNSQAPYEKVKLLTSLQSSRKNSREPTLEQKKSSFRNACRENQIENMKKAIRFDWNASLTLEYLKSIQQKTVESQEILIEAMQHERLQYLVELIVPADSLFKSAVLSQCYRLLGLLQTRFEQPSSILLLGNLCALYTEFIEVSQSKRFLTRLIDLMARVKANLKSVQMCSWALTQISRQPHLLVEIQVIDCLPNLYTVMAEVFGKQSSKQLRTHLCRLVSHFSAVIQFPSQFLYFLTSIQPSRQIDKVNLYIALQTQIKTASYSQNTDERLKTMDYLLWLHNEISGKLPNSKGSSIFHLVSMLIKKSEPEVALHVAGSKFSALLVPYKYANKPYYCMIYEMLLKLNDIPSSLIEELRSSSVLQNLINDISDGNPEVGFLCLRCVEIVVSHILGNGEMEYMEWLLSLGLQTQVESFLTNVEGNEQLANYGERLLDMISTN